MKTQELQALLLPRHAFQDEAMWVGVAAVVCSSVSPVLAGRFNDRFPRQVRTTLICLMLFGAFSFYWFLLLSYGVVPVSKCTFALLCFTVGSRQLLRERSGLICH